jgi:hypothetical protein
MRSRVHRTTTSLETSASFSLDAQTIVDYVQEGNGVARIARHVEVASLVHVVLLHGIYHLHYRA